MASSIVPMAVETSYRYEQNDVTKEFTDEPTKNIFWVDASCVGWVILLLMGFIATYAALFARTPSAMSPATAELVQRAVGLCEAQLIPTHVRNGDPRL